MYITPYERANELTGHVFGNAWTTDCVQKMNKQLKGTENKDEEERKNLKKEGVLN